MSRNYASIPALWLICYERLHHDTLEGIRPPPWVQDWLETKIDPGLLTKGEVEVYQLVEAKMAELAGSEGAASDEGEEAATDTGGDPAHDCTHLGAPWRHCYPFQDR